VINVPYFFRETENKPLRRFSSSARAAFGHFDRSANGWATIVLAAIVLVGGASRADASVGFELARPLVLFVKAKTRRTVGQAEFWRGQALHWRKPKAAIARYSAAIAQTPAQSALHVAALWQRAATRHRLGRSLEPARDLQRILASSSQAARWLREPAIAYLAVLFADSNWNGKAQIPGISTPQKTGVEVVRRGDKKVFVIHQRSYVLPARDAIINMERFFKGRFQQAHVRAVYLQVARLFFETARYAGVPALSKRFEQHWPDDAEAPRLALLDIRALMRTRRFAAARAAQKQYVARFAPGSRWWHKNNSSKARRLARRIRQRVLQAAARPRQPSSTWSPILPSRLQRAMMRAKISLTKRCRCLGLKASFWKLAVRVSPPRRDTLGVAGRVSSLTSTNPPTVVPSKCRRCVTRQLVGLRVARQPSATWGRTIVHVFAL
jgi:hypothetical protein